MPNEEIETLSNLVTAINVESYEELIDCFKKNLFRFKFDMRKSVSSIDCEKFWEAGMILKDLYTRIELLVKLHDFILYVGRLQEALSNKKE